MLPGSLSTMQLEEEANAEAEAGEVLKAGVLCVCRDRVQIRL